MANGVDGRRQRIVEATLDTIRDKGLASTRIQEIARRAGTSTGLVMYYFATLDGVIAAAMEASENAYYAQLEEVDSRGLGAPERLRVIVERSADPSSILGAWRLWMELWVRALRDENAAQLRAKLDTRWRTKLVEVIEQGVAEGVFRCPDPTSSMLRLAALLDGLSVAAALDDPDIPATKIAPLWLESAARELDCDRRLLGL